MIFMIHLFREKTLIWFIISFNYRRSYEGVRRNSLMKTLAISSLKPYRDQNDTKRNDGEHNGYVKPQNQIRIESA